MVVIHEKSFLLLQPYAMYSDISASIITVSMLQTACFFHLIKPN